MVTSSIPVHSLDFGATHYKPHIMSGRPKLRIIVSPHGAVDSNGYARNQWWHAPLTQPLRDQDHELKTALCAVREVDVDHPRWDRILGDAMSRSNYMSDAVILPPSCTWCGYPTWNWCDGFDVIGYEANNPMRRMGLRCGASVCRSCEDLFTCCLYCAYHCGVPTQDGYMNTKKKAQTSTDAFEDEISAWVSSAHTSSSQQPQHREPASAPVQGRNAQQLSAGECKPAVKQQKTA